MKKSKRRMTYAEILACAIVIVIIVLAVSIRLRSQPLLTGAVPLHDSIISLRVRQGPGLIRDVTYEIDRDELLYLLADTRIRRDGDAFVGFQAAEWAIEISQSGNRFHRAMNIALGERHGMITERGFRMPTFRISNGDEIREALERMIAD
jgi:hypothetical protein